MQVSKRNLRELFAQLFSIDELQIFIEAHLEALPDPTQRLRDEVRWGAQKSVVIHSLVGALSRHALLGPDLHAALRDAFPYAADSIDAAFGRSPSLTKGVILFLTSAPSDMAELDLDAEFCAVVEELGTSPALTARVASRVDATTVEQLLHTHAPIVVHFSGHGTEEGRFSFTDRATGTSQPVRMEELAPIFARMRDKNGLRCVVFAACFTAAEAEAAARSVDYLVAMQHQISDRAAIEFSRFFYQALAREGYTVREAFDSALDTLTIEGLGSAHIPRLYDKGELVRRGPRAGAPQ